MPQPIPEKLGVNQSLLFHPKVSEEANRLISCRDPGLISVLSSALMNTSADHV